jgi:hypothetical protein
MDEEYEILTREIVSEYMQKAKKLNVDGNQNIGEKLELAKEIQKRFGATEIMAINILNGRNVIDYIAILGRKKKGEPDGKTKE